VVGKRRALLISTDVHQDSAFRQLSAPRADVESLGAVLADPAIGAYDVQVLSNSAAHEVNRAIDGFLAAASLEDQVILYFSGHGFKDDRGRLYLITTDSLRHIPASTAVSAQFIRDRLDQCRSRRVIVILDCCYAGAFPDGATRDDGSIDVLESLSGRGSVVITATSAIGYALDGSASGTVNKIGTVASSVFTGALIDGLATGAADRDGDGLIGIDELYEYVYSKVTEVAPQQVPGRRGNIEGILYVATSPRGPRPTQLPAEFGDAVQSPLASVRLAVVSDLLTLCSGTHPGTVMAVHAALTQLADDDSRRVAAAALSALEAIHERDQPTSRPRKTGQRTPDAVPEAVRQEADHIVADARPVAGDEVLTQAREQAEEIEREGLARRVDDLRAFEQDYRSRLKAYLEGLLRDLETRALPPGEQPTYAVIEELRSIEQEYRGRLKAYLEERLHDLEAGVMDV